MIRHLFGYSRHGIKKRTIKILFKVRKLIINSDKSERESGSNNKISKKIPLQDNAEGIKFIKRFSRVIAYSRDELLFIIDNDKLKYITRNPLFYLKASILIK